MSIYPLSGINVLDISRMIRGPYATSILGDLGADVISIEPLEGNELRNWSTIPGGPEGLSGEFVGINRNKRSILIDLEKDAGRKIVLELAKKSDVLVESFKAGIAEKLGVGYEAVSSLNPNIIYVSSSGFGQTGPYRDREASDMVVQGMTGLIACTGNSDGPPCTNALAIGEIYTAENIVMGVLAALEMRDETGKGIRLDIPLFDVLVAMLSYYAMSHFNDGWVPKRRGILHNSSVFSHMSFEAKDGKYVAIQPMKSFLDCCEIYGVDMEWAKKMISKYPELQANRDQFEECREEVMSKITAAFKKKTSKEWLEILIENRMPCGTINNLSDVFSDPQVQFYKVDRKMERPPYGTVTVLANPIRATETLTELRIPPALPGEHTNDILRELGRSEEEITKLKAEGVVK